jgi:hypothetical protein
VRTKTPIVAEAHHFEWSSARAFAGLSRAPTTDVTRALALLGDERRRVVRSCPKLEDLAPAAFPVAGVELVLAAAAQTFGVAAADVAAVGRAPLVAAARGVYVTLGRLEGFRDPQLAAPLGRTARRVSQLAAGAVDLAGVRIARTLLRVPALRERLGPPRPRSPAFPG